MRAWFVSILCLFLLSFALGQGYTPKQGETVLRLNFEGKGSVYIKLHSKEAPRTTSHIASLASSGFYDGQKVFRAEKSPKPFIVQMGDPQTKSKGIDDPSIGKGGSGSKVDYEESGYPNDEGAVGLAAIPGDKNSGDSQFYILLGRARFLDGNYTVFGQVVAGMDVVRKLDRGDKIVSAAILK